MSTALSLLGVVVYIAAIISLAAAITWAVVRLFPPKEPEKAPARSSRN